jgi:hypothetical protein
MVKVQIIYPLNGMRYPITDPPPGRLRSAYVPISFGVINTGGPHRIQWGFDKTPILGTMRCYNQATVQQVYKLPGGPHTFWVKTDGGNAVVKFRVGA